MRLHTYKSDEEKKSFSEKEDGELSFEEMYVADEKDGVPLKAQKEKMLLVIEKEAGFLPM